MLSQLSRVGQAKRAQPGLNSVRPQTAVDSPLKVSWFLLAHCKQSTTPPTVGHYQVLSLLAPTKSEQEETWHPRVKNEVPSAIDHAAACGCITSNGCEFVFCSRRHCTEAKFCTSQKTNAVSLCVSNARGRHVKETRDLSQVQNEVGPEADPERIPDRFKLELAPEKHDVYSPL